MNEPEIIERLTAAKPYTDFPKTLDDAIAEIRGLRAALKPFADALTDLERVHSDPGMLLACCRAELTLYEFSQARFAYEQSQETKP